MASINKDATTGTYKVRYRKPDRTSSTKRGFKTKRDAELWMADNVVKQARGEFIDVSASKVTIAIVGDEWIKSQTHLKPSALRPMESAWRVHVEPRWGKISLADIKHSDVQTWLSSLTTAKKSATIVIRCHSILSRILEVAVKDRRLSTNVAKGVKLPRKVKKEHTYLTHTQAHALAEESKYPALVLTLAYTGLRWGEVTGLRVKDVNPLRRRLNVVQNAVAVGNEIIVGTPKSHKKRSVPFPAFLADALTEQMAGKSPDDLLFPGEGGGYLRRSGTSQTSNGWFINAVKRAGLPRLTPHDLRHTAASLAISAGANVKAVQLMLGHASATMTLDTYADLFPDDLDAVAVALNDAAMKHIALKVRSQS